MGKQHVVTILSTTRQPRAIAIVLGHLGASRVELHRLSQFYRDRNCAVVAARSPPWNFMWAHHGSLRSVANQVLQETHTLKQQHHDSIPVVVHMFSNGGTFLFEELQKKQEEDQSSVIHFDYIFFDSCPCYLHMPWALSSNYWKDAFPIPGWSPWFRKLYLLGSALSLGFWCFGTASLGRSRVFWKAMQADFFGCDHLIYAYTTADIVTDVTRIDELIIHQKQKGKNVSVYRYEDSNHVRIHRDHPEEYNTAIDIALQGAIDRAKERSEE